MKLNIDCIYCHQLFQIDIHDINKRRYCSRSCYKSDKEWTPKRFWEHVEVKGIAECWHWSGTADGRGYGLIRVNDRRTVGAHRFAWETVHGAIADGLFICHKCDNPPCCNPYHLFIGTHQDNMRDKTEKGRHNPRCGSYNGNSKLTETQVFHIYRARGSMKAKDLAAQFGIDVTCVFKIWQGRTWNHLTNHKD